MEREINLILRLNIVFALGGSAILLFFTSPINSALFLLGAFIMIVHFIGIKGISAKLFFNEKKKIAIYAAIFMGTIALVILVTFYLLKRGKLMVIYFLSGTLTLALATNVVMIKVLLKGESNGREDTLDS